MRVDCVAVKSEWRPIIYLGLGDSMRRILKPGPGSVSKEVNQGWINSGRVAFPSGHGNSEPCGRQYIQLEGLFCRFCFFLESDRIYQKHSKEKHGKANK